MKTLNELQIENNALSLLSSIKKIVKNPSYDSMVFTINEIQTLKEKQKKELKEYYTKNKNILFNW